MKQILNSFCTRSGQTPAAAGSGRLGGARARVNTHAGAPGRPTAGEERGGECGAVLGLRGGHLHRSDTAAWRQEHVLPGGGDQCDGKGGSRAKLNRWAGPWGGGEWCGARNRRANAEIHRLILEFFGLGMNSGSALQVFDRMCQRIFNSNF